MPLNRSKGSLRFDSGEPREDRGDETAIEIAAVRLLAGRELSAGDIRRKLQTRRFESGPIDAVIGRLTERGMLSDDRFVTAFINQHSQRGHGPGRIRAELRQRGVAPEVIDEHLRSADVDWDAVATRVCERKFRPRPASHLSRAERAKQARFLQYRGFTTEQVRAAMGKLSADADAQPDAAADADIES